MRKTSTATIIFRFEWTSLTMVSLRKLTILCLPTKMSIA